MLSDKHIAIIQSTIPVLEQGGTAITDHFYSRMFSHNPELKHIFNMSNQHSGRQKTALFDAILAYAKYIDQLDVLAAAVERITHKHSSLFIKPAHYTIVGHHLIETFREQFGAEFTADVEQAWTLAYQQLANLFIDKEETIYSVNELAPGGWRGKRTFVLVKKEKESELVTTFVFAPKDEQPVVSFLPGQYIGIELSIGNQEYRQIRQYSLSAKSNNLTYQISVKREATDPEGLVSNYLHNQLEVGDKVALYPPAGDFHLQLNNTPTVLISAGVGITPMKAMLDTLDSKGAENVTFIHACENESQHSFARDNMEICERNNWNHHVWYRVGEGNNAFRGLIDLTEVALPKDDGHFYMCGPVGFMKYIQKQLIQAGVDEARIHYEVFGPHATLQ